MRRRASRTARSSIDEGSGGRTDRGPFEDASDLAEMVTEAAGAGELVSNPLAGMLPQQLIPLKSAILGLPDR